MILEYAQLMSTAHRLLDGELVELEATKVVRKQGISLVVPDIKSFLALPGETVSLIPHPTIPGKMSFDVAERKCYLASHVNHPCAVWTRETSANYSWLYELFAETSAEFKHRYKRDHKTWLDLSEFLRRPPRNIPAAGQTPFPQAMDDTFKDLDVVTAYRNYYLGRKARIARWTNRQTPDWFKAGLKDYNASDFERTL